MQQLSLNETLAAAIAHHRASRLAEAERLYRQVLAAAPDHPDALHLLGNIAMQTGHADAAVELIQRAAAIVPTAAHYQMSLGYALTAKGRLDDARSAFHRALSLKPDMSESHHGLGNIHAAKKQFADSVVAQRRALDLKPDYPEAWHALGIALTETGQHEEAAEAYRQCIRLRPAVSSAYLNLGLILAKLGRLDEAIEAEETAVRIDPASADAHWHLSMDLLLRGDFERGWAEYEWRWRASSFREVRHNFPQPAWDGSDPRGRTILIYNEQGFGDTIQFIRYAAPLAQRGAKVIFACTPELIRLMHTAPGIAQIITKNPPPPFDLQCPLMSLPYLFKTRLDTIPRPIPYLAADPELAVAWGKKMAPAAAGLRVGLSWAGRPLHFDDANRSLALGQLAPLMQTPGVTFYSLQVGVASPPIDPNVKTKCIDLTAGIVDFADTAAIISHLDLVISVDTAVGHLAGAMGKPTWVLLPFRPDWRWLLNRTDSPWYPTLRLFRQSRIGDWAAVIEQVAVALQRVAREPGTLI